MGGMIGLKNGDKGDGNGGALKNLLGGSLLAVPGILPMPWDKYFAGDNQIKDPQTGNTLGNPKR